MAAEIENEFAVPDHVNVAYIDVINEPDSIKEHKVVKTITRCTSGAYTICQVGIYLVLQILLGTLLSVWWGFWYGVAIFFTVWLVQPFIRLFVLAIRCFLIPYKSCVRSCCDPFYISVSHIFTNINFLHRRLDEKPLEHVVVAQPPAMVVNTAYDVSNAAYNVSYPTK